LFDVTKDADIFGEKVCIDASQFDWDAILFRKRIVKEVFPFTLIVSRGLYLMHCGYHIWAASARIED